MLFRRNAIGKATTIAITVLAIGALAACSGPETAVEPVPEVSFPDPVSAQLATKIDEACRAGFMDDNPWQNVWDLTTIPDMLDEPMVISARGEWAAVLYVNDEGGTANCTLWLADDNDVIPALWEAAGWGWPETGGFTNWALGALSGGRQTFTQVSAILTDPLPPDGVVATEWFNPILRDHSPELREGFGMPLEDKITDPPISLFGRVGSDVTDLVIHTFYNGDIAADIANGWFAALWVGEFGNPPGSNPWVLEPFTAATVTLRDGTTFEVTLDDIDGPSMDSLPNTNG